MSEDHLFDVLAILVFVVLPFVLASLGLALAVRSRSVFWPFLGYAVAVAGTWLSLVAGASVADCPSQNGELCGDRSGLSAEVKDQLLVVLLLIYALAVVWWRSREPR